MPAFGVALSVTIALRWMSWLSIVTAALLGVGSAELVAMLKLLFEEER